MIYVIRRDREREVYSVFNTDYGVHQIIDKVKLYNTMYRGLKVENYEIQNGELVYSQGAESKMPGFSEDKTHVFVVKRTKTTIGKDIYLLIVVTNSKQYTVSVTIEDIQYMMDMQSVVCVNAHLVEAKDKKPYMAFNKGTMPTGVFTSTKPNPTPKAEEPTESVQTAKPKDEYSGMTEPEQRFMREHEDKPVEEILTEYDHTKTPEINKYVKKKANGRFGKQIKNCLIVGLLAATIVTSTVGCGTVSASPDSGYENVPVATEVAHKTYTLQELQDKLSSADKIDFSINFISLGYKGTISVDGEDLLQVTGKWLKLTDELTITDMHGTVIATAKEEFKLIGNDNWVLKDANGNVLYKMIGNFGLRRAQYTIQTSGGTEVGKLAADLISLTGDGYIKDTSGNIMYDIGGVLITKSFSISKSEESESTIDGISLVLMGCCFRSEIERTHGSRSSSSSSRN